MSALFQITAVNAASALLLAVAAGFAARYVRRPAVAHALWVVVLLQLFMPPVLRIGVLPPPPVTREAALPSERVSDPGARIVSNGAGETALPGTAEPRELAAAVLEPRVSPYVSLERVATAVWLLGAVLVGGLAFVRAGRFRRLLKMAETRSPALELRLGRLSRRMAVRAPRLRVVGAPISPLIWPRLGGAELLFPSGLLNRLDATEKDALLAHELAHVARRDHWVRFLELIAVSAFWWHPVVWWARSRLRLAEERCCDQRVLRVMHRNRPSYARGLLKTVEFLAVTGRRSPALASGVGEVRDLEDRLTMIMKDRPPDSLSTPRRVALALGTVAALLIFPTWSDGGPEAAAHEVEADRLENHDESIDASAQAYRDSLLDLERQALELEVALREVRERQRELEREWGRTARDSRLERRSAETARREASRARAEELALREQAAAFEREMALESRREDLEIERRREAIDRERALAEGELDRAADLEREAEQLGQYAQQLAIERELQAQHFERQLEEAQLNRLRDEAAALREAGHDRRAAELEAEAQEMLEHARWEHEQQAREIEMLRREHQLEELSRRINALEAEGREDEAGELMRRLEALERAMDRERSH